MATILEQIAALEASLATGAEETEVRQGDVSQRVKFRKRDDIIAEIARLRASLGGVYGDKSAFVVSHSRD